MTIKFHQEEHIEHEGSDLMGLRFLESKICVRVRRGGYEIIDRVVTCGLIQASSY